MSSEKEEVDALAYMTSEKVNAAEDDSEEAEVSEAGFLFCGAGLLHVDQNKRGLCHVSCARAISWPCTTGLFATHPNVCPSHLCA